MVNILKGKLLYPVEYIVAQILCVACRRHSGHPSGYHAEIQRQHSHHHQDQASLNDIGQIALCDADVNDLCHFHRYHNFHKHFQQYKKRSQNRLLFVFPNRF